MAQTSWPFHNPSTGGTPVDEDQWSRMARQWAASGVVGYPGDTGLQVYANGSGREVHVRAGMACVRGHWFRADAQETLAIAANTSGNPRIDRVVVRLDPSADGATFAVLTGTPAGSPSAPALTVTDTGVYELTLARVSVADAAATITAGNVIDERVQVIPPALIGSSTRRPQSPLPGQTVLETDTGALVWWDGAAWPQVKAYPTDEAVGPWEPYTATMKNSDGVTAFSGATETYRWKQVGKLVIVRGKIFTTTGFTYAGASPRQWLMPLPAPMTVFDYAQAPVGRWSSISYGGTAGFETLAGDVLPSDNGHVQFTYHHAHPTQDRGMDLLYVGNPGAADYSGGIVRPATTDITFGFQIMYEAQ